MNEKKWKLGKIHNKQPVNQLTSETVSQLASGLDNQLTSNPGNQLTSQTFQFKPD